MLILGKVGVRAHANAGVGLDPARLHCTVFYYEICDERTMASELAKVASVDICMVRVVRRVQGVRRVQRVAV